MKPKTFANFKNGDKVQYTGRRAVGFGWRVTEKETGNIVETGFSAHMKAAKGHCVYYTPKLHDLWEYATRGHFARSTQTPEKKAQLLKRARAAGCKTIAQHKTKLEIENTRHAAKYVHEIVPVFTE